MHILFHIQNWKLGIDDFNTKNAYYRLEHKSGFIDYPIYYTLRRPICYDHPEKIPQVIKTLVNMTIKLQENYGLLWKE